MVGTTAQIARDIAALEQAVTELADSIHGAYANYLTVLGQAIRSQLVLACYHICTQSHPDRFLTLSYNQRQQLQKTLKYLAAQVQDELLACLLQPGIELVPDLDPHDLDASDPDASNPDASDLDSRSELDSTVLFRTDEAFSLEPSFFLPAMPHSPVVPAAEVPASPAPVPQPITPSLLSQWHRDLEQAIAEELRTASHAANRILQQAGILSKALPEPLLDITGDTEGADIGGSVPNVLNILVSEGLGDLLDERGLDLRSLSDRLERDRLDRDRSERHRPDRSERDWSNRDHSEGDRFRSDRLGADEAKSPVITQLSAVHLRLAEIEFADATVTTARTKIRTLLAQLRNLGRDYQKKMRARAIAEAQAAWRSSWMED